MLKLLSLLLLINYISASTVSNGTIDGRTIYISTHIFGKYGNLGIGLERNGINNITAGAFEKFQEAEWLLLGFNNIDKLSPDMFYGLKQLKTLDLKNNYIESVNAGTFEYLEKLVELYLVNNRISYVEPNSFSGLSNIEILSLNNNRLKTLYEGTFNGSQNIKILSVTNNFIETIEPGTFAQCTRLTSLSLFTNRLTEIYENTFQPGLDNMASLVLSNNQITKIHKDAFRHLGRLVSVDLSANLLKSSDNPSRDNPSIVFNLNANPLVNEAAHDFFNRIYNFY
jgi:Leucine-rich repeat (LRR) protein